MSLSLAEILITGIELSVDAFAVSATNGMCKRGNTVYIAALCGLCFYRSYYREKIRRRVKQ